MSWHRHRSAGQGHAMDTATSLLKCCDCPALAVVHTWNQVQSCWLRDRKNPETLHTFYSGCKFLRCYRKEGKVSPVRPCLGNLRPGHWAVTDLKQKCWHPPNISTSPTPSGEGRWDYSADEAVKDLQYPNGRTAAT